MSRRRKQNQSSSLGSQSIQDTTPPTSELKSETQSKFVPASSSQKPMSSSVPSSPQLPPLQPVSHSQPPTYSQLLQRSTKSSHRLSAPPGFGGVPGHGHPKIIDDRKSTARPSIPNKSVTTLPTTPELLPTQSPQATTPEQSLPLPEPQLPDRLILGVSGLNLGQENKNEEADFDIKREEKRVSLPARKQPAKGDKGDKMIKIKTNTFEVAIGSNRTINRYTIGFASTVNLESVEQKQAEVRRFSKEITKEFGRNWSFDSTQLMTLRKAKTDPLVLKTKSNTPGAVLLSEMKLTFSKTVSSDQVGSEEKLMIANVQFHEFIKKSKLLIEIARRYYFPESIPVDSGQDPYLKLTLFSGFSLSISVCQAGSGLQLTTDVCHKVMSDKKVLEEFDDWYSEDGTLPKDRPSLAALNRTRSKIQEEYSGCMVMTIHNKRCWRVDHIDWEKTLDDKFEMDDGSQMSFRTYYLKTYKLQLTSKDAGLLVNIPKNSAKKGGKVFYLPPEICLRTGVTDYMKSQTKVMRVLADMTRLSPSQRFQKQTDLMAKILGDANISKEMIESQFRINSIPREVNARILGPFEITFKNKTEKLDDRKDFSATNRDAGYLGGAKPVINSWLLLASDRDGARAKQFADTMKVVGGPHVTLPEPQRLISPSDSHQDFNEVLTKALKGKSIPQLPQFVLCAIPKGSERVYRTVKELCTNTFGIVSQCFSLDTISRKQGELTKPVAGNCLKQIMTKLGHLQWKIDFTKTLANMELLKKLTNQRLTMFVGIDVCHESQSKAAFSWEERKLRSTVGFCASYDKDFTSFHSWISYQTAKVELVHESKELMIGALEQFKAKNKSYPDNIVVYRDGVGQSQIESFVMVEIAKFEEAFESLKIKPKLTVIVVQKRLQMRLFDPCPSFAKTGLCRRYKCDGQQQFHSPLPGTVVDTDITHSKYSDFYLVPSLAPPGATARPTCFIVVRDDLDIKMGELQTMTNQFCYLYYNWPGPIRVPAACMYAHKIAYQFGKQINGSPHVRLTDKLHYL